MPSDFLMGRGTTPQPTFATGGKVKVVDVSDEPDEALVLRYGYQVPPVQLDESLIADFVATDKLDGVKVQPRVVSQSIAAGTRITRGTSVDIVLADPFLLDGRFIPGSHADTADLSLGTIAETFLADDAIRTLVQRSATFEELPQEIQTQIRETAGTQGIRIQDGTEGQDAPALYRAIQAANTYN